MNLYHKKISHLSCNIKGDMKLFDKAKKGWENIWLPRIREGKTKIELERDKRYEARWVWYHTILAVFLGLSTFLLLWIAINLQIIVNGM